MGQVIDLAERREAKRPAGPSPVGRLDSAIAALEPLVHSSNTHPAQVKFAETELLAINGAISIGNLDEAARRAEDLAVRLRKISKQEAGR